MKLFKQDVSVMCYFVTLNRLTSEVLCFHRFQTVSQDADGLRIDLNTVKNALLCYPLDSFQYNPKSFLLSYCIVNFLLDMNMESFPRKNLLKLSRITFKLANSYSMPTEYFLVSKSKNYLVSMGWS